MKVGPGGKRGKCTCFIVDVMRFIVKVGRDVSHAEPLTIIKPPFDVALCTALVLFGLIAAPLLSGG